MTKEREKKKRERICERKFCSEELTNRVIIKLEIWELSKTLKTIGEIREFYKHSEKFLKKFKICAYVVLELLT